MKKITTRIKNSNKLRYSATILVAVIVANLLLAITAQKSVADQTNCDPASGSICGDGQGHNYANKKNKDVPVNE